HGLSCRRERSQCPISLAPASLAYILLSIPCRGNCLHTSLSLQCPEEETYPMKRPMVARAMLAAMALVMGSIHMPGEVAGLSGDVFAQGVTTWKEVTIYKTVPPGPSDEEVITREQVVIQEVPPILPSRGLTEIVVRQPPPPPRQEVIVTAPAPPPPLRQEVIVAAPSSRHIWVAGYWTW